MKELTKAEEQVMQELWKLGQAFVKDIISGFPEPKPAYNTISTIVRILEKKGFVGHQSFGKSHRYYPLITKKEYTRRFMKGFMRNYFSNSVQNMVSFFVRENKMSVSEMEELKCMLEEEIKKKKEEQL